MASKFKNVNEEYEFAKACAEYAANKISQNVSDEEVFRNTLVGFTKEVMNLGPAGFACAIDNLKDLLAQRVSKFVSPNSSSKELEHNKREEIAMIVAEQLIVLSQSEQEQKRDILIKVITDFHQLENVANSDENEYYKKRWLELQTEKKKD